MLDSDAGFGEWVESTAYKIQITNIQRCDNPEAAGQASSDAATGERLIRVGVTVHVLAESDELLVAPRDVKIREAA